jgi:hypothetical protein
MGKSGSQEWPLKFPQFVFLGTICVGPPEKRRILWKYVYVRFALPAQPDSAARKAVTNNVS